MKTLLTKTRLSAPVRHIFFGVLLAGFSLSEISAAPSATIYVSPAGSDSYDGLWATVGSGHGPVKSLSVALTKARDRRAANTTNPADGFLIVLAPGYYPLSQTLTLLPSDSGSLSTPTTLRANATNTVTISGALDIIPGMGVWTAIGNGVYEATLPGDFPTDKVPNQLFVSPASGTTPEIETFQRRYRPRFPASGYLQVADVLPVQELRGEGLIYDPPGTTALPASRITLYNTTTSANPTELVLFHSWSASLHSIASIDTPSKSLLFTEHARYPVGNWELNQRYYLDNVTANSTDLQAGEWTYTPGGTRKIRYKPLSTEFNTNGDFDRIVHLPLVSRMVFLFGKPADNQWVQYVTIDNLNFRYAARDVPSFAMAADSLSNTYPYNSQVGIDGDYPGFDGAVFGNGVDHVIIKRCEIGGVGEHGIRLLGGTKNVQIIYNHIHDLGSGGVQIGDMTPVNDSTIGWDTATAFRVAENVIVQANVINDGSQIFPTGTGIVVGHANHIEVRQNRIANFDYAAIAMGRVTSYQQVPAASVPASIYNEKNSYNFNNIIADNHISNIGNRMLSDGAAIYLLGRSPDTIVARNWIHHCASYRRTSKIAGIYLDEGSSGILVDQNVITYTEQTAFTFHYGTNNEVKRNLFYAPGWDPVQISKTSDRGLFGKTPCADANPYLFYNTINFHHNVIVLTDDNRQDAEANGLITTGLRDVFYRFYQPGKNDPITLINNAGAFMSDYNLYWSDLESAFPGSLELYGLSFSAWNAQDTIDNDSAISQDVHALVADPGASANPVTGWATINNTHGLGMALLTTQPGLPSGTWLAGRNTAIVPRGVGERVSPLPYPAKTYFENFDSADMLVGRYPRNGTTLRDVFHGIDSAIFVTDAFPAASGTKSVKFTHDCQNPYTEYRTNLTGATKISFSIYIPTTTDSIPAGRIQVSGRATPTEADVVVGGSIKIFENGKAYNGAALVGTIPPGVWANVSLVTTPLGSGMFRVSASLSYLNNTPIASNYIDVALGTTAKPYNALNRVVFVPQPGLNTDGAMLIDNISIGVAP